MRIDPAQVKWDDAPDPAAVKWDEPNQPRTRAEFMKRELLRSPPVAVARGIKDVWDTAARGAAFVGDKVAGALGNETRFYDQVSGDAAAGRREFDNATEGTILPKVARVGGNLAAVGPAVRAAGAAVSTVAPSLGSAVSSFGMSAGGVKGAAGLGLRTLGGGISGGISAGLVNPEEAGTGAAIGAAMPGGIQLAGALGRGAGAVTRNALGLTTGVGAEVPRQALRAGMQGNREFLDNMRGNVPIEDVLTKAKSALSNMRTAKSAQYRSGMVDIKADKAVLAFNDIDDALRAATETVTYKGQVKNESAATAIEKMRNVVAEWRRLDPAEFHTPEGLDALKQRLGGIIESIPMTDRTARLAAGQVYNATKDTINAQAPTYARVMKDYTAAASEIDEIERALSLGKKASADTSMRKLQSLMRNNVQTNYGNRLTLAEKLATKGGEDVMPSLAGQASNSWTPRSLASQAGASAAGLGVFFNPWTLAALPLQSPRLVGEATYGLGRAIGGAGSLAPAALTGGAPSLLGATTPAALPALGLLGYQMAPVLAANR